MLLLEYVGAEANRGDLAADEIKGIDIWTSDLVKYVEVRVVAAVAPSAGYSLHIAGIAKIAFFANFAANLNLITQPNGVNTVQEGYFIALIFNHQSWVADGVKIVLTDRARYR